LLGYVSTVALFGAEFLLPVYLQSLRGRSALETGIILLPMALMGGIMVTISGRIYDRIGPRVLLGAGFLLLVVNTWQLSQLQANTPITWILFLLALRGMSLGMIVQTTMVTALSVVPTAELARGSALTNATRLVVQSIGVAVLATVLVSTLTPDVRVAQTAFEQSPAAQAQAQSGLCEGPRVAFAGIALPQPVAFTNWDAPRPQGSGPDPAGITALKDRACQENVAGFERAYRVTFFAAILALILGLMLPGWPGKWSGRQAAGGPPAAAH
jgi:hypothetical protein